MRLHAVLVMFPVVVVAACSSKESATSTSASTGTGASTSSTGGPSSGSTNGSSTGSGAASSGSGSNGSGGSVASSTSTASGASTSSAGSSGAGGSCATSPTFKEVVAGPLSGCAGLEPPCHNAGAGGLTITSNAKATWKQLVNVPAMIAGAGVRVVPGDPATSFLYRKLTNDLSPSEQPPMPEPPGIMLGDAGWQELSPADIEMVRCWIASGAPDN